MEVVGVVEVVEVVGVVEVAGSGRKSRTESVVKKSLRKGLGTGSGPGE